MLAYAANRPAPVERRPHPNAMLMIVGAHVAVFAAVMSVKMDLPQRIFDPPPTIFWVPQPKDPPPQPPQQTRTPQTSQQTNREVDHPPPLVPTDQGSHDLVTSDRGDTIKLGPVDLPPNPNPPARLDPVRTGAQLLTPASELKPPYPASKLLNEEEASLTLRLTVDANGRVVAVQPVGRTDPVFLEAARKHLIAHWRYKPAMEGGEAVTSSMVITLRFQLDG